MSSKSIKDDLEKQFWAVEQLLIDHVIGSIVCSLKRLSLSVKEKCISIKTIEICK